jgi:copper chaperone CopZ
MVSSYVIDDDDSDASNEMDMLMTNVDISLPATNAASAAASAAAAASPRMPSMPSAMPPPPPQQMFDMTTGQFHPDFMFCGECKDPSREPNSGNSGNDVYPEEENVLESYNSKPKSNKKSKSQQGILIRSKFHLSDPVTSASHILVIQSLLQPLPGVSKVMLAPPLLHNQVLVDHDAQTSTDSILQALASVGHPAVLQAPQASADHANEPIWVRSNFHVQGICCASEVPIVKKIIKPLPGVSRKIQINITTRTLYVQHDLNITTAPHIATRLTQEGFPATIQKDGAIAAAAQQQALHQGRTTLHVNGVLIDQDIAPIQQRLSQIIGVSRIGVNVSEAVIYVHHDVYIVSAASCVAALQPQYDCLVHLDAAQVFHQTADAAIQALDHIGRSKYVESTIRIDNFSAHQVRLVETTIRQNFIRSQVRAIYPHVQSQTLKVEHNPKLVSVLDVCHTLNSSSAIAIARSTTSSRNNNQEASCTCTVAVNGADLNLWLPLQEDYPHPNQQAAMDQQDNAMMQIHLNVWLSGIFWFVSILSLLGGMWYVFLFYYTIIIV